MGSVSWFLLAGLSLFGYVGVALAFLGGYMWMKGRTPAPIRFYENGVDIPALDGRVVFHSYGDLTPVIAATTPPATYLHFKTRSPLHIISLPKSMAGLEDVLESVRDKLGREEWRVELEPTEAEVRAARRHEHRAYTAIAVAALGFGAVASAAINVGDPLDVFLAGFGLFTPSLVIQAVAVAGYGLRGARGSSRLRLDTKVPALLIVAMLVLFVASRAVFSNAFGPSPTELHIGPRPASTAVVPGTYENQAIRADGHVRVDAGETLELRNSTLVLNLTADGQYGIWVATGGHLVLDHAVVEPADPRFLYTFEIMGSAVIRNSTVSGLWGVSDDYDGGLEVYSDDVKIEGSHILNARQSGVLVVRASPLIANSTIEGSGDDGIELQASRARIVNNLITRCEWGLYVYGGSRPVVERNVISNNSFGILILESYPVIRNNTFEFNEHAAISYTDPAVPDLSGNQYIANGTTILREGTLGPFDVWTVLTVGSAIMAFAVVAMLNWGRRRQTVGMLTVAPRPPHL